MLSLLWEDFLLTFNLTSLHSTTHKCLIPWHVGWVIVAYGQLSNFSAISWREQINFHWEDDEVRFVLELDFYSASSLKQQSADRHAAPLGHIILNPSQPVFALTP